MTYRPDLDTLLLHYAAGTLDPAESFMIAAMLALNAQARMKVMAYEHLCGQLIHEEAPAPMSAGCLDIVMQRIEVIERAPPRPAHHPRLPENPGIPPQLHALFHRYCVDELLAWAPHAGGVRRLEMHVCPQPSARMVQLLHLEAHSMAPPPQAENALALILNGASRNEQGQYRTGEVVVLQRLQAGPDGCLYLTLSQEQPRQQDPWARLLSLFFKH